MMEKEKRGFEPKIVAFLCNWCSYAAADLAGISRFQYPPNLRVVRVMCSGSISPHYVIHALQMGADGVIVAGCHIGDCHYLKGNYMASKRITFLKRVLELFGFDSRRVRLEWISAAEGRRFTEIVTSFTEEIRKLGPINSFQTGYSSLRRSEIWTQR